MEKYFQTSDGTAFFEASFAHLHAKTLEDRNVKEVTRSETQPSGPAPNAVKETIQAIIARLPEMDLATAEKYLAEENASEMPRKGAVEALTKRISELKAETSKE